MKDVSAYRIPGILETKCENSIRQVSFRMGQVQVRFWIYKVGGISSICLSNSNLLITSSFYQAFNLASNPLIHHLFSLPKLNPSHIYTS